jgi:basic membrane protein A and related proteins
MLQRGNQGVRRAWAVALAVGASAAIAAGCGSSGSSSTGGGASSGGGGNKSFKVAMLLPGSVSDQTYNADGQRTANAIKQQLGINVTVSQSVQVPNQANVYSQFASQGYNLVIGWGGQFTDGAVSAAPQFPKTQFLVVNGTSANGSNLNSMDEDIEQWQFIGGYVAGRLSKSKTVGWVGGQCFPATAAQLNGTKQGVLFADKGAKFLSTFTGDFEDPTKAQQAAQGMIGQGADVLTDNLNNGTFGLIKAAQSSGNVKLILEWQDNHALAPQAIASDVLKSQASIVVPLVKKAENGGLGGKHYQVALPKNWGPAVAKTPLLPQSIYQDALKVQKQVADGTIKVQRITSCPK